VISNPGLRMGARKPPLAFTDQGVAMLSSVLRSKRAIQVNIAIMRAFVAFREMLTTHKGRGIVSDPYSQLRQDAHLRDGLLPEATQSRK
jgi:hypothetical protein